jgi:uncharacterized protein (TIGR00299 family) protein
MILGALVDLGVPLEVLRLALEPLPLDGWTLASRKIERRALTGTKVDVGVQDEAPARTWRDIETIIDHPSLAPRVRERSLAIFRRLIEAEAEVHGTTFERAHLHEAGATDAIVDIVGACVGIEHLGVDEIVVSEMTTGFGDVRCAHGTYPVPAPATLLLLRGVPVRAGEIEDERLTPTGAAVLTTLADRWARMPPMRPDSVGYGAGSRDLGRTPNLLRMVVGHAESSLTEFDAIRGEVAVLECTMDDATPQALSFAARRLLDAGAVDVHTTPVTMKKGRQGHHLTVLARPDDLSRIARMVLSDTTTLGLRFRFEERLELERRILRVETRFGLIEVKVGSLNGDVLRVWPEYDTCAALADRHAVPLWDVQQAALEGYAATCKTRDASGSEEETP